jgi:hypothetical protein
MLGGGTFTGGSDFGFGPPIASFANAVARCGADDFAAAGGAGAGVGFAPCGKSDSPWLHDEHAAAPIGLKESH